MKTRIIPGLCLVAAIVAANAFQESAEPKKLQEKGVTGLPSTASSAGKPTSPGRTFSSFDRIEPNEELMPPGTVALVEADVAAAFALYERISQRSVIPGNRLPSPMLSYRIQTALPRRELLQALDTFLAQYGITLICMGTNFMKAVNEAEATREAAPEISSPAEFLPDSNSYLQYVVRLQHQSVNNAIPVLQPLARLPNSLLTVPSSNMIVIRDYSANVRRMLNVLQRFDAPETGEAIPDSRLRPRR